jgi:tetratricopeptide (TPR) repeat protein
MKQLHYFVLTHLLCLSTAIAQQNCNAFDRLLQEGNVLTTQKAYIKAINKYQAAMTNCPNRMAEVQPKIKKVFEEIELLREKAEKDTLASKQTADKEKERAFALLENIAERELKAAYESLLRLDLSQTYAHLQSSATAVQPQLKKLQLQYIASLAYTELYAYPLGKWAEIPALRFFQYKGEQIVVNFDNKTSAFATEIAQAQQKTDRQEARRYLQTMMQKALGKALFQTTTDLFEQTKVYPFTFKAADFEPNPTPQAETAQVHVAEGEELVSEKSKEEENNAELARQYSQEGDYAKAYQAMKKALAKNDKNYADWYSLSWYALFVNQPQEAIIAAKKSLEINLEKNGVISNMVLGYLISNQWKKAKSIYEAWKDKSFKDNARWAKDIFLADIADLEKAGVKHKDFVRAKKLLAE